MGEDRCFERLVILDILEDIDDGLGGQPVTQRIAAGFEFALRGLGPVLFCALRRLAAICLADAMGNAP